MIRSVKVVRHGDTSFFSIANKLIQINLVAAVNITWYSPRCVLTIRVVKIPEQNCLEEFEIDPKFVSYVADFFDVKVENPVNLG